MIVNAPDSRKLSSYYYDLLSSACQSFQKYIQDVLAPAVPDIILGVQLGVEKDPSWLFEMY